MSRRDERLIEKGYVLKLVHYKEDWVNLHDKYRSCNNDFIPIYSDTTAEDLVRQLDKIRRKELVRSQNTLIAKYRGDEQRIQLVRDRGVILDAAAAALRKLQED